MGTEGPGHESEREAPFAALLGIRVGASGDGAGKVTMNIRDEHRQEGGVVQGGLIVTLADYAMYQAVKSMLEPGQHSVTVEIKVNFTAPAKDGELTATGRVISGGRRIIVAEAAVTDDRQTLIAHGLCTSMVVQRRP